MNNIRICLVFTNKTENNISNVKINISSCQNGTTLIDKTNNVKSLASLSQQKQIYQLRVDDWVFDPLSFDIVYNIRG